MRTTTVQNGVPFALTPEACERLGDDPISVESCISQEYFEKERDRVFRKSWLMLGREDQVPKPGDYFVQELEMFNTSLLIARGRDGVVRAFHNVCSHRCNKLVWDDSGNTRSFVCGFHGWSYQTDGALRFVPQEEIFPPIDHSANGLTPVATGVWRGFIFVKMDGTAGVGLDEFMAPFTDSLESYPFEQNTHCYGFRTVIDSNWKLTLDAFLESYHVRFLHQQTVAELFRNTKDEAAADAYGIELFKRHGRFTVPGVSASRSHPLEDLIINTAMSFYEVKEDGAGIPPGLNNAGGTSWAFDGLYIFPNTLLLINGGGAYVEMDVQPLGPDRSVWTARSYSLPAKDGLERFVQEYNVILGRDTMLEDGSPLEVTQAVLASGAKKEMILGDQELMLRHLHDVVDQVVNGEEASIA
ncbi:SRPBCC family protein [Mycolicibacterium sp. YH-1]|uniref:aromatic ring-hydroxylating oxygenase subunit alpha n=1 Tax=Mycolicibacterium sp. YH-1 TaxID=2908837 RepID=UPI001F4BEF39|nr:aromatic ring-hydroxylating dioxygenase subunit alpha [Mycolicibacterium sp. YH-1]UNB54556.1 aromatic ring-hydroxylating dioxygenase subunit alpha [Mycolicibacterium sp. YH-1]